MATAAALVQAVGNLLSNAWKYTRSEGRRIAVTVAADPKHVYIAVIDNGLGIAASEQKLIFEKFQRGAAARERGGPGLGPRARHRACHRQGAPGPHRGDVRVDQGARFRITLPRSFREAT